MQEDEREKSLLEEESINTTASNLETCYVNERKKYHQHESHRRKDANKEDKRVKTIVICIPT